MESTNILMAGKPGTTKGLKGLGIGALGLGIACLGCCFAPLMGILAATGLGASILAGLSSKSALIGIMLGTLGLSALLIRYFQKKSCCPNPRDNCNTTQCGTATRLKALENQVC